MPRGLIKKGLNQSLWGMQSNLFLKIIFQRLRGLDTANTPKINGHFFPTEICIPENHQLE